MTTRLTLLFALLFVLVGCRAEPPHRRRAGVSPVYSAPAGSKRTAPARRPAARSESPPVVLAGAPLVSFDLKGASLRDAVEILRASTGINIVGEYSGNLSNGGEEIVLQLPQPLEAAILRFEYSDAWHPATDGDGKSLTIAEPLAHPATWSEPESWRAAAPTPGE